MAALLGMLWAWVWALGRIWKGLPIVADDRAWPLKPAPWGSLTVLSLVFLYLGVNMTVSRIYAAAMGRHLPRVAKAAENQGGAREPGKAIDKSKNAEKAPLPWEASADEQSKNVKSGPHDPGPDASTEQSLAELMFQFAVSNGLLLVLVPAFVRLTSGAGLADLGLHRQEWPRQMGIGVRAAMLMTPPVCAIHFLTVHIWRSQAHPVEQMVLEKLTVGVAILAVLSTMVLAPWIEELLFRGIFQRWLGRLVEDRPLPTTTIQEKGRFGPLEPANESFFLNSKAAPTESTPIDPGSEIPASSHQPAEQPASLPSSLPILLTSFFFAAMHLPQWPAPIAILLLSMALGTVYQRTGSLLAAITMHATFNGVNTLFLLLAAIGLHIQAPIQAAALPSSGGRVLTEFLSIMGFM
ncbi:MAG: lysostaphin resistance A-like protein [Isosphaeraceae bacterium]